VAAASTKVHVIFTPKHGLSFAIVFHVPGAVVDPNDAGIQAIVAAINALTRAVSIEITLSVVHNVVSSAAAGASFQSIDKAFFPALDADGSAHNFKVPGLKAAILLTDDETVDMTNALVTTYVGAVTTHAKSPGNVAVTTLLNGRRNANRKLLKTAGTIVVA
jgi:hypothetical protein